MSGNPVAVLRRAATLAPSVLPPALAEIAADEIGIELSQLEAGTPIDSIDERVLAVAEEILGLLPADYAARAAREVEAAGWRSWSAEVAADVLHLVDTWSAQGPGPEAAILVRQIRELLRDAPAPDAAEPSGENAPQASADFHEELAEDVMIGYGDYLRDKRQRGVGGE